MGIRRSISLSVHELVDSLFRSSDIDNRVYNLDTMAKGSELHRLFQGKQAQSYEAEVPLSASFELGDWDIALEGRADGIIKGDGKIIVDEIKSTVMPLEKCFENDGAWHFAQAKVYGYLYLKEHKLDKCLIRVTYLSQVHDDTLVKEEEWSFSSLEEEVLGYLAAYVLELEEDLSHVFKRNASLEALAFPYGKWRMGQREMSGDIYRLTKEGGLLFLEAPTGLGKTMSALFPALKALGEKEKGKVFYLTAKTTGRQSAYEALTVLYEKGLTARDSLLVAKEKMCLAKGAGCNPDECPYAKRYYAKLWDIRKEARNLNGHLSPETILEYATRYEACPFELQLDLSYLSDVVIADFNYLFDPIVHLERYFDVIEKPTEDIVLVDEAHNLVERGRESYSATIAYWDVFSAYKSLSSENGKSVKTALRKLMKSLEEESEKLESIGDIEVLPSMPPKVEALLESLLKKSRDLENGKKKGTAKYRPTPEAKELMRELNRFKKLLDGYMGHYELYLEKRGKGANVRLFTPDPAPLLLESLKGVKAAALYSATFSPLDYYEEAIAGSSSYPSKRFPSPFPKENFKLVIAPSVDTRYANRTEETMESIARHLEAFVNGKKGNYMIFFPSFSILERVIGKMRLEDEAILVQTRSMKEKEREKLLAEFKENPQKTTIGFFVLGGAFGESVDLPSDRLIGVAIVGPGIPQVSAELDLIKKAIDEKEEGKGYDWVYKNPGMNKVMQAVGRLIRSEKDVGAALLIDSRFLWKGYRSLFPVHWDDYEVAYDPVELSSILDDFYKRFPDA